MRDRCSRLERDSSRELHLLLLEARARQISDEICAFCLIVRRGLLLSAVYGNMGGENFFSLFGNAAEGFSAISRGG